MNRWERSTIYGKTGEIGRDGILAPEQQQLLESIQNRAADKCLEYIQARSAGEPFPMVAMATGIGKGRIIHKVNERQFARKPDSKVLIIAGTKIVLVDQTHEALAEYLEAEDIDEETEDTATFDAMPAEDEIVSYHIGYYGDPEANVQIATIQTIRSAFKRGSLEPSEWDLLIIDEVHNIGTPQRKQIVDSFTNVVGFTATPLRYSGDMKVPEEYGFTVIESLPLPDAQEMRLLPPLCGMQIDTKTIIDRIPLRLNGSIDYKKLERMLKQNSDLRPFIADRVAQIITVGDKKYKTVVVVNFVWEAQELAELFLNKGIKPGLAVNARSAREIDSDSIPALDAIARYKQLSSDPQSVDVLISPYVASEGFDAPFTEVLVWASPTDSPLRYTQFTGRLARRAPGKLFGLLIDCLYQTNQYNWSYNFGMWMKDHLRQLDNGLLWLGPEADIETIKGLPAIREIGLQADSKTIEELQQEGLLEVQEGEFPIILANLMALFVGDSKKLTSLANIVLDEIAALDPNLVQIRKSGSNVVRVVTDKNLFRERMVALEANPRDDSIEEVKPTDFVITGPELDQFFIGDRNRLIQKAKQVLNQIERTQPDLVATRVRKPWHVKVVTDRDFFIRQMVQLGFKPLIQKEGVETDYERSETDFWITQFEVSRTFIGSYSKNLPIVKEVVALMQAERPDVVSRVQSGGQVITVVKDKNMFIAMMKSRQVKLKSDEIGQVVESDFPLSLRGYKLFIGVASKVKSIANQVAIELRKSNPDKFLVRRSGSHYITVYADRQEFIERMIVKGAVLKPTESLTMDDGFIVTGKSLARHFIGSQNKLLQIANEALNQIRAVNPELIVLQKHQRVNYTIITDKSLFVAKMVELGVKVRERHRE